MQNLENGLRHERVQHNNHKVTSSSPLFPRYFTKLAGRLQGRDPDEFIVAHNGWTTITEDFGGPHTFHYLRRNIGIWEDCVKLYYGSKKADSPYLWAHMEKYVSSLAAIFQGFRIDNCHSTPIHVLDYFVNHGRAINPNLFVFAELFTSDQTMEAMYMKKIGLNAVVRESIYVRTNSPDHI